MTKEGKDDGKMDNKGIGTRKASRNGKEDKQEDNKQDDLFKQESSRWPVVQTSRRTGRGEGC